MNGIKDILKDYGVNAALVITASNTFYLSGYESTNCRILITNDKDYFFTDMRYLEEAKNAIGDRFEVLLGGVEEIKGIVDDLGIKALGVEENVSYGEYRSLEELFKGVEFVAVDEAFSKIRAIKTEREISLIKTAQSVTETAFNEILPFIKEGVTEIEIAARLEYIMLKNGCELAFDSIVAFGENGSKPHAHRSERKLKRGEFVTMDFGAKYKGYCSDMTRTVFAGTIPNEVRPIYDLVLKNQKQVQNDLVEGASLKMISKMVENDFRLNGYNLIHALGHGVGLEIHELPYFSLKNDVFVKEKMVLTNEPGIYLPNQFGVRIEDTVKVTKSGSINLTKSDKNYIIVGK